MRPVALLRELLKLVGVELHGAIDQLHHITGGRQQTLTDVLAHDTDRLAHRLARGVVILVRPQQADQLLSRAPALGRSGEVQEQRDVFLPAQLGRGFRAIYRDFERSQRLEANHRAAGAVQFSSRVRVRAVSARAP